MHELARFAFGLSIVAFLLSWATAAWNIMLLRLAVRRDGRPDFAVNELFSTKKSAVTATYPEARRFMRAMLAGIVSWCVALAVGLGSGMLH